MPYIDGVRQITDDERALLTHISRYGSDGYPIVKFKHGGWTWGPWRTIQGPPTIFKTKREAIESFKRYLDVLEDALAEAD